MAPRTATSSALVPRHLIWQVLKFLWLSLKGTPTLPQVFANLSPFTPHRSPSSSKCCLWDGMRTSFAAVSKNFHMKTLVGSRPLQELCQRPQPFESIPQRHRHASNAGIVRLSEPNLDVAHVDPTCVCACPGLQYPSLRKRPRRGSHPPTGSIPGNATTASML